MNIFKRRERAIKLGYNLSLCSRVSQSATNINSSSYMNPTGLLNVQSNLTRFQRANTKTNCQLVPKSKFSQTFHSATLKSKIGDDNANDNTKEKSWEEIPPYTDEENKYGSITTINNVTKITKFEIVYFIYTLYICKQLLRINKDETSNYRKFRSKIS